MYMGSLTLPQLQRKLLDHAGPDWLDQVKTGVYRSDNTPESLASTSRAILELASVSKRLQRPWTTIDLNDYLKPLSDERFRALDGAGWTKLDWRIPDWDEEGHRLKLIKPSRDIEVKVVGDRGYLRVGGQSRRSCSSGGAHNFGGYFIRDVMGMLTPDEARLINGSLGHIVDLPTLDVTLDGDVVRVDLLIWNAKSRALTRRKLPSMTRIVVEDTPFYHLDEVYQVAIPVPDEGNPFRVAEVVRAHLASVFGDCDKLVDRISRLAQATYEATK